MGKYEAEFSNLVRAYRKKHMGKGPAMVEITFCKNWAICEMEGNLSPVEKFIVTDYDGKEMIRSARTKMFKKTYQEYPPLEMEELLDARYLNLFVDIDIEQDLGMSVYVFDEDIEEKFCSKKC
ncbi:DUF2294 domain-containing protein [Virgibacillus kekensis]|uniref:DUF2294 domain-containing protein n=1 Tax=Virgibacillus kekensis TaxID=202261 RepID=A0ABV9DGN6_9BACI